MKINIALSLSLLLVTCAVAGKICSHDSQCGSQPYAYCKDGYEDCSQLLLGLAVDVNDHKVYYGEVCRAPDDKYYDNGQKKNTTLKWVSMDDGTITNMYSEQYYSSSYIEGIWGYIQSKLYINIYNKYNGLYWFDKNNYNEKNIMVKFYESITFTNQYAYACVFDKYTTDPSEYRGYYNIYKYNGIPSTSSSPSSVYSSILAGGCAAIYAPADGNLWYGFTSYDANKKQITSVYRGTEQCRSCNPPAPQFVVSGTVGGYCQDPHDNSKLYFGTEFGLFVYFTATGAITQLSKDAVKGSIVFFQGYIYYNNGYYICSYNIQTKIIIYVNYKKTGECKCAPGFTGDYCQTCNGQIQWDNYNNPYCVPTNENGNPVKCKKDWDCGNSPYTYCNYGKCQCRPNFTGPKCDQCAGLISISIFGVHVCLL